MLGKGLDLFQGMLEEHLYLLIKQELVALVLVTIKLLLNLGTMMILKVLVKGGSQLRILE